MAPEPDQRSPAAPTHPIVRVSHLEKSFPLRRTLLAWALRRPTTHVAAVDDVSLELWPNEVLGIVGESGSGKSTLARCLIGLHRPDGGAIHFDGEDVTYASGEVLRGMRGRMQMVFQDPYSSLNPLLTVGAAIAEAGAVHGSITGDADEFARDLLGLVGLPRALGDRRPRQLSGGQRQRVAIARALAVRPEVIIADEVVSALDVSVQAQILNLFIELRGNLRLAMLFIAHDLAVVSHISDRVAIMYLGRIVETGPTSEVFSNPQHPYTKALLAAHPDPVPPQAETAAAIRGDVPSALVMPSGCRFRNRCEFAESRCARVDPRLEPVDAEQRHQVACVVRPFSSSGT